MSVLLLPTGLARAADASTEKARQHFLKGQQFFDVGRWDEAAAEFEQAYAARNDPVFIYNMAQAYRRKGDAKHALELYKNYLIKAPRSPQRAEVEERIATLQQQVEEAERAARGTASGPAHAPSQVPPAVLSSGPAEPPAAPPPSSPSPEMVASPPPAPAAAPVSAPEPVAASEAALAQAPTSPPSLPSTPGKGLRIGGIVCGAAGLAAVGAGFFFSLETDDYSSTVERAPIFNPNFDDRGKLYQTLQWVGYGLGAALVATGAVLYGLGVSARNAPAVAIAPAVLPGGAGLGAKGAF
ncbi:MAG: tetratricopeptide repeat protein [Deltaproteobacteria bacterium]|nr:tetratricopeptide repeat protein [Deltaproteobacteria bacterium]